MKIDEKSVCKNGRLKYYNSRSLFLLTGAHSFIILIL